MRTSKLLAASLAIAAVAGNAVLANTGRTGTNDGDVVSTSTGSECAYYVEFKLLLFVA